MLPLYAATLGLSAMLMFAVQPIISKILLPTLGGGPLVWNTAVMFFELMLLLGYAYVHVGKIYLGTKKQALLHAGLIVLSLLSLPLAPHFTQTPAHAQPVFWMVGVLLTTVGLPFFVLSSNAPLLSSWLAHSKQKEAKNPYMLYAASNAGSLFGLLSYPVLVEPLLTLHVQRMVWSAGYALLAAMLLFSLRAYLQTRSLKLEEKGIKKIKPVAALRRAEWALLAFVPSSLMLSVTSHITVDIAPIPLLWVLPLACYLLSFIFVFASKPIGITFSRAALLPVLLPLVLMLVLQENDIPLWPWILGFMVYMVASLLLHPNLENTSIRSYGKPLLRPILFFLPLLLFFSGQLHYLMVCLWYVVGFFLVCMVCHGRLISLKPAPAQLTEFYFFLALGGALGGMFNVLLAPLLFAGLYELPILLAAAFFLRPLDKRWNDPKPIAMAIFAAVLFWVLCYAQYHRLPDLDAWLKPFNEWMWDQSRYFGRLGFSTKSDTVLFFAILLPALMTYYLRRNTIAVGVMMSILLLAAMLNLNSPQNIMFKDRNVFGSLKVWFSENNVAMYLVNGNTQHGFQFKDEKRAAVPTSYYDWDGPLGALVEMLRTRPSGPGTEVAAVGLGAGTVACLAREGQRTTFFEINPMVDAIAHRPKLFSFLRDCPGSNRVVMGDARLSLQTQPDHFYSLIILDAFTSDAVPIHLLTREALELYIQKLAPQGVIAYHISNRNLDLKPVVGNLAAAEHLAGLYGFFAGSDWVFLARNPEDFGKLATDPRFRLLVPDETKRLWTDDYSNVFSILNIR